MINKTIINTILLTTVTCSALGKNGYWRTKGLSRLEGWKRTVMRQDALATEEVSVYLAARNIQVKHGVYEENFETSNIASIKTLATDFAQFEAKAPLNYTEQAETPSVTLNSAAQERFNWGIPFAADKIEKRSIENRNREIDFENNAIRVRNSLRMAYTQELTQKFRNSYANFINANQGLRLASKGVNPHSLPKSLFTEELTK
jgi:hypothetical protein